MKLRQVSGNQEIVWIPSISEINQPKYTLQLGEVDLNIGIFKGYLQATSINAICQELFILSEALYCVKFDGIELSKEELSKALSTPKLSSESNNIRLFHRYVDAYSYAFAQISNKTKLSEEMIFQINLILNKAKPEYRHDSINLTYPDNNKAHTPPYGEETIKYLVHELLEQLDKTILGSRAVNIAVFSLVLESISPFQKNNRAMNRVLTSLMIQQIYQLPFSLMTFNKLLYQNQDDYLRALASVKQTKNWSHWINFITKIIIDSAKDSYKKVEEINSLRNSKKQALKERCPRLYSEELLDLIFTCPQLSSLRVQQELKIKDYSARRLLNILEKEEILTKVSYGRVNYYVNQKLVDILELN